MDERLLGLEMKCSQPLAYLPSVAGLEIALIHSPMTTFIMEAVMFGVLVILVSFVAVSPPEPFGSKCSGGNFAGCGSPQGMCGTKRVRE